VMISVSPDRPAICTGCRSLRMLYPDIS
jgi:hypothetical protein